MANLPKKESGLNFDVWIYSMGKDCKVQHHRPCIKIGINDIEYEVIIDPINPKVIWKKEPPEFSNIKKWIANNYDILYAHWNKTIRDRECLNTLVERSKGGKT